MPYQPTTNFRDSNGVDLGKKLVTKDYLLSVYGSILDSATATGLTVTPALWVWGFPGYGRLGTNDAITRSIPVTTFAGGNNWKSIELGQTNFGAIKTDGTLWLSGRNHEGQLGINNIINRSTPVTTFLGGNNWQSVSCSGDHTAAIKTDGTLWTWGYNVQGGLGNNGSGVSASRSIPITTFAGGNNWKSVSLGSNFSTAIKTDGTLWVWGVGSSSQLGINVAANRLTPVTTFSGGNNWKSVSCGAFTVSAIKTDGSLWVWGSNSGAILGTNDAISKNTPVTTFAGGFNWISCSFGDSHLAAIKNDGTLWVWGNNTGGQLGINNTNHRSTPVTTFTGGNNWKSVSCGYRHTIAIKTDGSLWVWGRGTTGQLGNNASVDRSTPVTTFAGGNNWKSVSASGDFSSSILSVNII